MPLADALSARPVAAPADPASRDGTVAFWVGKGAPPHVAQGIADRVNAESGFNSSVPGDKGTSGGLYQHHADRLSRLQSFAASMQRPWTDPMVQHEFSHREVMGGDAIAAQHWKEIMASPDRATAAKLWDKYFERSAGGPGSGGAASAGSRRMVGRLGGMGPQVPTAADDDKGKPKASDRLAKAVSPAPGIVAIEAAPAAATGPSPLPAASPLNLRPSPVPQAPNLRSGYTDALASILAGKRPAIGPR